MPVVVVSTGASWRDVALRHRTLVEKSLSGFDAKELAGIPDLAGKPREQQIVRLLEVVRSTVRYTGIEFGMGAIVPSAPREVWQRRFGDCKDQATLLIALLRAHGIASYPALLRAGTTQDVDPDLPSLVTFDHVIVRVDKPSLWIDPTSPFSRVGEYPWIEEGRNALVCREGSAALETIPALPLSRHQQTKRMVVQLGAEGHPTISETTESGGWLEESERSSYAGTDESDRKKFFEKYLKSDYAKATLVRFDVGPPRDLAQPFKIVLEGSGCEAGDTQDLEPGPRISAGSRSRTLSQAHRDQTAIRPRRAALSSGPRISRRSPSRLRGQGLARSADPQRRTGEADQPLESRERRSGPLHARPRAARSPAHAG